MMNKKRSVPAPPEIGVNLKKERVRQKMSLDKLSSLSGVSKAMLSQIETGKVNPTIVTVWKIVQAFKVDFNVLLKGEVDSILKFEVNRHSDLTVLDTGEEGVVINVLSPASMADDMELYILTLKPGACLKSKAHSSGTEEFLTVLKGELQVKSGSRSSCLKQGDLAIYQCDVPHSIENISDSESQAYLVVRFQKPGS